MFLKRQDPYHLVVNMTGVKLGDRVLQIGCAHGGRLAAVASKVGLSGRAVAAVPDEASASRARKGAADAGVLVEIEVAQPTRLPFDEQSFDLAVIDDTAGLFGSMSAANRAATIREIARVVRTGGRTMIIGAAPRGGLGKLFGGGATTRSMTASGNVNSLLTADGFTAVRTLGEREGLVFVEGVKPRMANG